MQDPRPSAVREPFASDVLLSEACRLGGLLGFVVDAPQAALKAGTELLRLHGLESDAETLPVDGLLSRYPVVQREQLRAALWRCAERGESFELTLPLDPAGGGRHRLLWCGQRQPDGRVAGFVRDDSALWRAFRREAMERELLAAMTAGRPLSELLDGVAQQVADDFPLARVQILSVDHSDQRLHHSAGRRMPEAFRAQVDGMRLMDCEALAADLAEAGGIRLIGEIASASGWEALAGAARDSGLRACWMVPALGQDRRLLAWLLLFFDDPRKADAEATEDLRSAASLVALAISQVALLENFRQLLDSAVEVICVVDEAGRFVTVNRAAIEVWGMPQEALIGKRIDALVHADDLQRTYAVMAEVMRGVPVRDFHNRNVAADGRVIEMRWSASWSADTRRMYCYGRDVTAQRQTDDQMRLLQRAMDSSSNGVLIADARQPDVPVIYANAAMTRITGYEPEAFLGRNCRFLQGEDREQPALRTLRRALRNGTECRVVLRNYRRDGSLFWNELFIAPVRDASGLASHYLGVVIDVTERQRFQQDLARATSHDALTELPRYAALVGERQNAPRPEAGDPQHWWLLFIDLDRFHAINESLGDRTGDLALRQVAERLRTALGDRGQLSRFAGDEFVALVPALEEAEVLALAESLRRAVAAPLQGLPFELQLSASIGISGYPQHGHEPGELLRRAEAAMTQAKREGRDGVCLYSASSMREFEDRMALGLHLRGAVERDELDLHFQPQLGAGDGRLIGFETLVRWSRSPLGEVPPGRFIPVAEALGLMPELGSLVLRGACRQIRRWRDAGLSPPQVAVNISALQLLRPDFAQQVAGLLAEHGVPSSGLQIELTESLLMENVQRVRGTLDQLRELGVSLALDDFGTGYSSLAYLKRFAFDKLKIDKSFVDDLGRDGSDAAIARTIITIGHQLGMKVSAEGVETPAQLRVLRELGCDELQGYLLGRPQPAALVEPLLRAGRVALPP